MASKSYGWDVRNIAKISPKMVKKRPFFDFRKKYLRRLLYRTCGSGFFFVFFSPDFFMKISNFSKTVHTIVTKFCSHSTPKGAPACAKASKSYGLDVRNIAKISPKMAKKQPFFDFFRFSQKLSIRFERNFLQLFYTILESHMCNGIKIVWLGCEKHSQN